MKILVMNGPNLNMLGQRDTAIYGKETLSEIEDQLKAKFPEISFEFFQSNHEGALIDKLQESYKSVDAVILNPGALAHYSISLRDTIEACKIPVIEVHLSNIFAREEFRQHSVLSPVCSGIISGFAKNSYFLAVHSVIHHPLKSRS